MSALCVVCEVECDDDNGCEICEDCGEMLDAMEEAGIKTTFLVKNWWWLVDFSNFYGSIPNPERDCFGEFQAVIKEGEIRLTKFAISKVGPPEKVGPIQKDRTKNYRI